MDFMQSSRMTLKHLERLRHIKNEVSNLEARARDTAEAIEATLDEDEDMCMMRLSLLRERPAIFKPPISPELLTQHEDVELLLESLSRATRNRQLLHCAFHPETLRAIARRDVLRASARRREMITSVPIRTLSSAPPLPGED